jgi:hypothetical protein
MFAYKVAMKNTCRIVRICYLKNISNFNLSLQGISFIVFAMEEFKKQKKVICYIFLIKVVLILRYDAHIVAMRNIKMLIFR